MPRCFLMGTQGPWPSPQHPLHGTLSIHTLEVEDPKLDLLFQGWLHSCQVEERGNFFWPSGRIPVNVAWCVVCLIPDESVWLASVWCSILCHFWQGCWLPWLGLLQTLCRIHTSPCGLLAFLPFYSYHLCTQIYIYMYMYICIWDNTYMRN